MDFAAVASQTEINKSGAKSEEYLAEHIKEYCRLKNYGEEECSESAFVLAEIIEHAFEKHCVCSV